LGGSKAGRKLPLWLFFDLCAFQIFKALDPSARVSNYPLHFVVCARISDFLKPGFELLLCLRETGLDFNRIVIRRACGISVAACTAASVARLFGTCRRRR
jgi:hypothetical protein